MSSTDQTPRQRRRESRHRQLRTAAMTMIVDHGLDAFSINKLADRVDLTPGALYRYFDSRDALLAAVQVEVLDSFDHYFQALHGRLDTRQDLHRIVAFALGYAALADIQPRRFQLISAFLASPAPVLSDQPATELIGPTLTLVEHFATPLQNAASCGVLHPGNPLARAALLWSSLQGFITHKKLARLPQVPLDADALLPQLVRTLLAGWGACEAELGDAFEDLPHRDLYREILKELR